MNSSGRHLSLSLYLLRPGCVHSTQPARVTRGCGRPLRVTSLWGMWLGRLRVGFSPTFSLTLLRRLLLLKFSNNKKKCGHSYVHFHAFYLQKMLFTHLKIQLTFSQIGTHLLSCTFGAMKSILRSKTERPTKIHSLWLERKRASLSHFILQVWFVVEICL